MRKTYLTSQLTYLVGVIPRSRSLPVELERLDPYIGGSSTDIRLEDSFEI